MITLAASMFDIAEFTNGAAAIGEALFLAIGTLVAVLLVYSLARHRLQ